MSSQEKKCSVPNEFPLASDCSNLVAPQKKERLNNNDILRYSRQLILPEIGVKGMEFPSRKINTYSISYHIIFQCVFIRKCGTHI